MLTVSARWLVAVGTFRTQATLGDMVFHRRTLSMHSFTLDAMALDPSSMMGIPIDGKNGTGREMETPSV
jgi:hypothetical protein